MEDRDTHGARWIARTAVLCCLMTLVVALQPAHAASDDSDFKSPLFGWGSIDDGCEFSYVVPLYYHRGGAGSGDESGGSTTLLFPILTGLHHSALDRDWRLHGAAAVPLLALIGSAQKDDFCASGYVSPYLGVGSLRSRRDGIDARWSGASLLPWVPFVDDLLQLNLYAHSSARSKTGAFSETELISFPWLDISVYDARSAGIEEDTGLLNVWGISLYRSGYDLPERGFRPWFRDSDALHGVRSWGGGLGTGLPSLEPVAWDGMAGVLSASRSGMPVDYQGIIDPMITWSYRGESLHSLGLEPVFHYDADEGYSIPFLLTSFGAEGIRFGPAARHLFPLLHGNKERTRWDFALNYGTVYALEDYTAVDLKLLFNYQHRDQRGTAWGLLPFPFGRYPGYGLNPGARFVQLDNHLVSYWNMDGRSGLDIAYPFIFSMSSGDDHLKHSALLQLLYCYESDTDGSSFSLGPFGFPFCSESSADEFSMRLFWLFGYESTATRTELDLIGIPLLRSETRIEPEVAPVEAGL